jgi:transcriptional regulator with XRE-family HTH domain
MARIADHPLRLARIKAGLSQQVLADKAGVQRSAVSAIEDGRTKRPTDKLLAVLGPALDVDGETLREEIEAWLQKPTIPALRPSAKNLLAIPPYVLSQYYRTFEQWRKEIAPTQTAFASMLRVNPAIIRKYENGSLSRLPDGISSQMLRMFEPFGFSAEYLLALEELERS